MLSSLLLNTNAVVTSVRHCQLSQKIVYQGFPQTLSANVVEYPAAYARGEELLAPNLPRRLQDGVDDKSKRNQGDG
ncbi:hypothetical protein F2Q68_00026966 [Brassica cretica]|uniref:Uncharacterized protein n=2 Tax=Brassica cretica TaxID=69181 RepID=A0ABQ7DH54_BRACR|nr:hypothetical protein F2Q68_00026966 [Brassica cretica]KAF3576801.1 hypothetical protein DY000_02033751 [Brassica cretica]